MCSALISTRYLARGDEPRGRATAEPDCTQHDVFEQKMQCTKHASGWINSHLYTPYRIGIYGSLVRTWAYVSYLW